jgi:hypothetical protein
LVVVGLAAAAAAGWWAWQSFMAGGAPGPAAQAPAKPLEAAQADLAAGMSPAEARRRGLELMKAGDQPDAAFLYLEYAGSQGDARAALATARFFDPTAGVQSGTIQKSASSARRWYREAMKYGSTEAAEHLDRLRSWVKDRAAEGDREAQALWESWS